MSTHSTTNRLGVALEWCALLKEEEQRQRQSTKEQRAQEQAAIKQQVQEWIAKQQSKVTPLQDHVYIIKASNGCYKIGISFNPRKRIVSLRREVADWAADLEIVHVIASNKAYILEQSLHKRFAAQRVIGEWFLLTADDIDWLRTL